MSATGKDPSSQRQLPTDYAAAYVTGYDGILGAPVPGLMLGIKVGENGLERIDFLSSSHREKVLAASPVTSLVLQIAEQLAHYFRDPAWVFTIPVAIQTTPFQQQVWRVLNDIPVGTTCSYGQIAMRLSTSARAVGNACRRNPVPILVPCHRVIATSGYGGYAGKTTGALMDLKNWLIWHESQLT